MEGVAWLAIGLMLVFLGAMILGAIFPSFGRIVEDSAMRIDEGLREAIVGK